MEALAALAERIDAENKGTYRAPSTLTVREFLVEKWLPAVEGSIRASTFASYSGHIYKYILPEFGTMLLRDLDKNAVDRFYTKLAKMSGGRQGQNLSAKTRRNIHITLRVALAYAVNAEWTLRNAAEKATKPQLSKGSLNTWTAGDLSRFLVATAEDPLAPLWLLYATTGLRRGEALGLQWRDLDFENGRLHVERAWGTDGEGELKTPKSHRCLGLVPPATRALRIHYAKQSLALGAKPRAKDWVFPGVEGKPLHPDTVTGRFVALQAGIPDLPRIRLHDLRHTWATLALEAGVHPKVVQEQLGHATIQMTLDTYSHVTPNMQEEAADRVAALFAS